MMGYLMLALPEPDRSRLARSPLDLVVCQVRFDAQASISTTKFGFDFQKALRAASGEELNLEPVDFPPPLNITLSTGGAQQVAQGEGTRGWRISVVKGAHTVTLMPDSLAVDTRNYASWEAFREVCVAALNCLTQLVTPEMELRIGLRYVDRLRDSTVARADGWTDKLQPALHGLVGHPQLGPTVLNQQQQVVLSLGDGAECRFAHGTLPAPDGLEYILDYDLYRQITRPFELPAIIETLDLFNTEALQLFQASITSEEADSLR